MRKAQKKKSVPRWYIYLAIVYALIGLVDSFILIRSLKYVLFFAVLASVWLIFNGGFLLYLRQDFKKSAYILPIYYIAFSFLAYFILSAFSSLGFAINLQRWSAIAELVIIAFLIKK